MSLGELLDKDGAAKFLAMKKSTFASYVSAKIYVKHHRDGNKAMYYKACLETIQLFLKKEIIGMERDLSGKEYSKPSLGKEIRKLCGQKDKLIIDKLKAGQKPIDIAEEMYKKLPRI